MSRFSFRDPSTWDGPAREVAHRARRAMRNDQVGGIKIPAEAGNEIVDRARAENIARRHVSFWPSYVMVAGPLGWGVAIFCPADVVAAHHGPFDDREEAEKVAQEALRFWRPIAERLWRRVR